MPWKCTPFQVCDMQHNIFGNWWLPPRRVGPCYSRSVIWSRSIIWDKHEWPDAHFHDLEPDDIIKRFCCSLDIAHYGPNTTAKSLHWGFVLDILGSIFESMAWPRTAKCSLYTNITFSHLLCPPLCRDYEGMWAGLRNACCGSGPCHMLSYFCQKLLTRPSLSLSLTHSFACSPVHFYHNNILCYLLNCSVVYCIQFLSKSMV